MDPEQARPFIRPWMVALVLAVIGVTGATLVLLAARHQHRVDRANVKAFLRDLGPGIERARTAEGDLEAVNVSVIAPATATVVHQNLSQKRALLEDARRLILTTPTPVILQRAAGEFVLAIEDTLRAVSLLDTAAVAKRLPMSGPSAEAYTGALHDADAAFASAESVLARLECRVELPECAQR